jgi:hypothetical protein
MKLEWMVHIIRKDQTRVGKDIFLSKEENTKWEDQNSNDRKIYRMIYES